MPLPLLIPTDGRSDVERGFNCSFPAIEQQVVYRFSLLSLAVYKYRRRRRRPLSSTGGDGRLGQHPGGADRGVGRRRRRARPPPPVFPRRR